MNGGMMAVLAVCGTWFIMGFSPTNDGWWNYVKFLTKGIGVYLLLWILLVFLYLEVVLKWLVF